MPENEADQDRRARRLVVVGGGFAGVEVVKGLRKAGYGITLIDRRNHHLFQPLLYQVATAALSPAQIATPIRRIFAGRSDVDVVLDEVLGVDVANRVVRCAQGDIAYDVLVLAAGATHTYFGRDDWAPLAPGLKTVDDAIEVRRRFLLAFERADRRRDPRLRAADMTFVVVGAGPTGVEMAGAMVEIAFKTLPREFRHVDTHKARVVLIEAMDRVLPTFPPELSARALRDLTEADADLAPIQSLLDRTLESRGIGAENRAILRSALTSPIHPLWYVRLRADPYQLAWKGSDAKPGIADLKIEILRAIEGERPRRARASSSSRSRPWCSAR